LDKTLCYVLSFTIDSDTNWNGFGIYIGYIFFFTIVTFLIDKFKVFDKWVHQLSLKSQENLYSYLLKARQIDIEVSKVKNEKHVESFEGECCDGLFGGKGRVSSEMKEYKVEYLSFLLDRPAYLASAPVDTPPTEGSFWNCCFLYTFRFAPGLLSDMLLYNFNSHSLLSMFATTKGHPFSRAEKRSAFLCQTCMALGFGVLVSQLSPTKKFLLNVFVVSPTMVSLKTVLYYLLACPCFRKYRERGGCARCFVAYVEGLGWILAVPIALLCIGFLLGMVVITAGNTNSSLNTIAAFAYSVHVISSLQETFMSVLLYLNGRHCFQFRFCCTTVFTMGKYLLQKIELAELVENQHYTKSQWRVCCCSCLLTIVHYSIVDDPSKLPATPAAVKASQVVPIAVPIDTDSSDKKDVCESMEKDTLIEKKASEKLNATAKEENAIVKMQPMDLEEDDNPV
jgi:hypothetical protein